MKNVIYLFSILILLGCAEQPLLTYQRIGGLAGVNDRLDVYPDGSFRVVRNGLRSEGDVTDEQLDEMLHLAAFAVEFRPTLSPIFLRSERAEHILVYNRQYINWDMADLLPDEIVSLTRICDDLMYQPPYEGTKGTK